MAYLGNGIYDLLDVIKASKDPSIAYEGLYQDPRRYDTTYYGGDLKTYPYGMTDASGAQALISSAFPQEYGVGSLFNPRIGRPEQSIYYKEPEPADPTSLYSLPKLDTSRFTGVDLESGYLDRAGSSDQDIYASLYSLPKLDTSRFTGVDLESGYLDRAGSSDQDIYAEKPKNQGIARLFEILSNLPTPFNLARRGLESLSGLNQRLRNTDFGQSRTLQEYFQRREARKDAERLQTVGQQLQQASERGGGYQPTSRAQNVARTESRRADKGLGQGGVYGL
jgi:hypothetical protein